MNLQGIISVNFDVTDQLLIKIFCICQILAKKWEIYFEKAYDSIRREVLYSIRIEFGILMKLVRLIKMCLKTCSELCIVKNLSDAFPIQNGLKE
jgi:hypothetical protein